MLRGDGPPGFSQASVWSPITTSTSHDPAAAGWVDVARRPHDLLPLHLSWSRWGHTADGGPAAGELLQKPQSTPQALT